MGLTPHAGLADFPQDEGLGFQAFFGEGLADGLRVILGEGLVFQHALLDEEVLHPPVHDLVDDVVRLAGGLGFRSQAVAFGFDFVRADAFRGNVLRPERGDVHGDIPQDRGIGGFPVAWNNTPVLPS